MLKSLLAFAALLVLAMPGTPAFAQQAGADAVTAAPTVNTCFKASYPADAIARKAEGTVTFLFKVDAEGEVLDARLRKSSGDAALDEAARATLIRCRFKLTNQSKPAPYWVPVQYVWTLPKPGDGI